MMYDGRDDGTHRHYICACFYSASSRNDYNICIDCNSKDDDFYILNAESNPKLYTEENFKAFNRSPLADFERTRLRSQAIILPTNLGAGCVFSLPTTSTKETTRES